MGRPVEGKRRREKKGEGLTAPPLWPSQTLNGGAHACIRRGKKGKKKRKGKKEDAVCMVLPQLAPLCAFSAAPMRSAMRFNDRERLKKKGKRKEGKGVYHNRIVISCPSALRGHPTREDGKRRKEKKKNKTGLCVFCAVFFRPCTGDKGKRGVHPVPSIASCILIRFIHDLWQKWGKRGKEREKKRRPYLYL